MASIKALLGMAVMLTISGLSGCGGTTAAGPGEAASGLFTQDYAGAVAKAKQEQKLLLLDFTGSDWCAPCQALEHTVFTSSEFAAYTKDKVAVMLDYPLRKEQGEAVKKQNGELREKYKIEGFPTVIIVDPATDKEVARSMGFNEGETPTQWLADIQGKASVATSGAGAATSTSLPGGDRR